MINELLDYDYGATQNKSKANPMLRLAAIMLASAFIFVMIPVIANIATGYSSFIAHAAPVATGYTTAKVQLRSSASTSSKSLGTIKKNSKVTITAEVFKSKRLTSASLRWYAVKIGNKSGYIKTIRVKNVKFTNYKATTTDYLNYRAGAGTSMRVLGTAKVGTKVFVQLPVKAAGTGSTWYRVKVGKTTAYMSGDYLDLSSLYSNKKRTGLAAALYARPTNGGQARIVYTFDKNNCEKRFGVRGANGDVVPQGLAYTGSLYYVLFGMDDGQTIVTYSNNGKRLRTVKVPYSKGHPNGFTWNPNTNSCYIFRPYQYRCNTWSPSNNRFGKVKIPYSSSGVAYDKKTNKVYVSSRSGIRVYSSDGRFNHERVFNRCKRSSTYYVQDCGAYGGFVFHGISGANKRTTNYIDVYRATDGKYMGSIKVNLGEIESIIVTNKGQVELLINHAYTHTEYIWKTPLNVNSLM